jgi:hypothetical protein
VAEPNRINISDTPGWQRQDIFAVPARPSLHPHRCDRLTERTLFGLGKVSAHFLLVTSLFTFLTALKGYKLGLLLSVVSLYSDLQCAPKR